MSFQASALVAYLNYKDVPELKQMNFKQTHKLMLFAMANYADDNFKLFPSTQTLANDACCCRRTAINTINELVDFGIVIKTERKGAGGNASNIYELNIINFLSLHGYIITPNEKGFLKAVKVVTQQNEGVTNCHPSAAQQNQGVQKLHTPVQELRTSSAEVAHDPITYPIGSTFNTWDDLNFSDFKIQVDQLKQTFGARFDDAWYSLTFQCFVAGNDEKHEVVPSKFSDIQKRFKAYALTTGKNDQANDHRYNRAKNTNASKQEANAVEWEKYLDNMPMEAAQVLVVNGNDKNKQQVWNGFVNQQIRFKNAVMGVNQMQYALQEYCDTVGKKFSERPKAAAKTPASYTSKDDISWLDDAREEFRTGSVFIDKQDKNNE